jgi:hypothetical protein
MAVLMQLVRSTNRFLVALCIDGHSRAAMHGLVGGSIHLH